MQVQGKISYLPHPFAWCVLSYRKGNSLSQANRISPPRNGEESVPKNVSSQEIGKVLAKKPGTTRNSARVTPDLLGFSAESILSSGGNIQAREHAGALKTLLSTLRF